MKLAILCSLLVCSAIETTALPTDATEQSNRTGPIVNTRNGSYSGLHNSVYNQDLFLRVPYAQPPVGSLRFAPPQSLNATWAGYRAATELGPSCVGYGEDTEYGAHNYTSEDCLSVNIVRPAGKSVSALPVAVFIHGGGWETGSSANGWYNMSFLVERSVQLGQPIVGVSLNYRLAGWGWLYSAEIVKEGSTNVGLRDQRLALHWIQENIASFGGDPSRVTIFGESAGSVSVGRHILAYNGRNDNLFHGAIGQSGSPAGIGGWNPNIEQLSVATANISESVCPDAIDKLACLRAADFEALNNAINATLSLPFAGPIYGPVVDGDIVARDPVKQLLDGAVVKVPYILGTNSDEASYYAGYGINTDQDLKDAFMTNMGMNETQALALMARYPYYSDAEATSASLGVSNEQLNTTLGLQFKRANTIATDIFMGAPTRFTAQLWHGQNLSNIYIYSANTTISVGGRWYGAAHGFELPYTFYNLNGTGWEGDRVPFFAGNPFMGRPQPYRDLAAVISGMWVGFFNTGIPYYKNQPVPQWPEYNGANSSIMIFDAQPTFLNTRLGKEPREDKRDFVISQIF